VDREGDAARLLVPAEGKEGRAHRKASTVVMPTNSTNRLGLSCHWLLVILLLAATSSASPAPLVGHDVALADGRRFTLNLPAGYQIRVAAEGLRRVRFMAAAPDGRLFATDLYNRTDNSRGRVYALEDFDPEGRRFRKVTPYLSGLRNPNSIAFYTDPSGAQWLYVALTDRLVRYRYEAGSSQPNAKPEVLATFPDYGLDYKYGGWHLTRTIAIGSGGKIYVSVGSSCNACEEKEEIRASVVEMSADGSNRRFFAHGLRNAVGMKFVGSDLYVTNMGADHLGDAAPEDTMYKLRDGVDYGWPYCYVMKRRGIPDPRFASSPRAGHCTDVPKALAAFPAHASPLGLAWFGDDAPAELRQSFLVALHGSSKRSLHHGYRVARVTTDGHVEDFITGFQAGAKVIGRPADIFALTADSFLVTDDYAGVIYWVGKQGGMQVSR
jgi:glucose/arabinose dehydrogenase